MFQYIINRNHQIGWEHEVHKLHACNNLPDLENQIDLWKFNNCTEAINFAKQKYKWSLIDGCKHCVPRCHTI